MNELLFEAKLIPEIITLKPMKYLIVDKKVTAESTEAFIGDEFREKQNAIAKYAQTVNWIRERHPGFFFKSSLSEASSIYW